MWLILSLASAEAPYSDVLEGWYLRETGQLEAANDRAVEALHLDPGDIAAHRLYVNVRVKGFGESAEVLEQYRGWYAETPGDPAARVGLANALVWSHHEMGVWCDELDEVLSVLPEEPVDRYWALRVQYESRGLCPGMTEEDAREALLAHDSDYIGFQGYALRVRLSSTKVIDTAWVDDLEDWYQSGALDAGYVGSPWREEYEGDAIARAQEVMLERAREQARSDDVVQVHNAVKVFVWAELEEEEEAARARHAELDPLAIRPESRGTGTRSWILRTERAAGTHRYDIYKAERKTPPARALVALRKLDGELEEGSERALWYDYLAENQAYQHRDRAALDSLRLAWESEPTGDRANQFAYAAALRGEDLDLALSAIDEALSDWGDWDPRGPYWVDGYDDWHETRRQELARMLDTRAWVHFQRGEHEAARSDMALALLLSPEPRGVHHLHMGMVLAELGLDEQALFHLGRGLAMGSSEARLERQAHRIAKPLFSAHRWSHDDFDEWVADQAPAELIPGATEEVSYRIGMAFPDLAIEVDGQDKHISDYEGVRVVDVWATWCGPCVGALPHVDEVAEEYAERGVTVLAVSVDGDIDDLLDFKKGPRKPDYVVAWAGTPGWTELRITGIPTVFVLDADGNILDHWTGAGGKRMERSLDRVLADTE